MFKKIIYSLCLCFLFACLGKPSAFEQRSVAWLRDKEHFRVLSTIGMIDRVVQAVGQEQVRSIPLISEGLDPHSYQLVKGDDEKLAVADLIFYNGLGLEHGPSLKQYLETSSKSVAVGQFVLEEGKAIFVQGQVDPHIWMDVSLWKGIIAPIVKKLSEAMPQHASLFTARGKQLEKDFDRAHQRIWKQLQALPKERRYLVTSHDAFNYFAKAYLATEQEHKEGSFGIRCQAPEGLAPESQISTVQVQQILNHLIEKEIHVVFAESNVSKDALNKIRDAASQKGHTVELASQSLYGDEMGPFLHFEPAEQAYLKMIEHNAQVIYDHLKPKGGSLEP